MLGTFRLVKPVLKGGYQTNVKAQPAVEYTDTLITGSSGPYAKRNLALFDVITESGVTLPREQGILPLYWFEGDTIHFYKPGTYTLREYKDINVFDGCVVEVPSGAYMSDDSVHFNSGIKFWPQVMFQDPMGIARVANDGRNLAFATPNVGATASIGFRLINDYGQVTEPVCINVVVIR